MAGTLYIVATPIGNLEDITLRALSTLEEVDLIAAEDTRTTHNLLQHFGISTPTTPYHLHSLSRKAEQLLEVLNSGKDVAIVSDAGTPGISDPGHELIAMAIENDVTVVAIPGPNAIVTALVVSGLSTRRFAFEGFLPRRPSDRRAHLKHLLTEPRTLVFYESPHRMLGTLKDMQTVWGGDRRVAVVREATKKFEEIHRGTVVTAIERFTDVAPRGEFTIVVAGAEPSEHPGADQERIDDAILELIDEGLSQRDAAQQVSTRFSIPKRDAYQRITELRSESEVE